MTKFEYKCPDCEVKWNVVDNGCYGNGCGCGNNCNGACGDPACGYSIDYGTPIEGAQPVPANVNPEPSPSEVPPMPPVVIEQTTFFAPAW